MSRLSTLHLTFETNNASDRILTNFKQNGGNDVLYAALVDAGVAGHWRYRVLQGLKAASRTPKVQARAWEASGVSIWCKPRGSDSGVKGVLIGEGSNAQKPLEVFQRLQKSLGQEDEFTPDEAEEPDEETMELLLLAITDASRMYYQERHRFIDAVVAELPFTTNRDEVDDLIEAGVNHGWLGDRGNMCHLTPAGQQWLDARARAEQLPVVPAAESVKETVNSVPTTVSAVLSATLDANDPIALILAHKQKLQKMLQLPETVAKLRTQITDVRAKISTLEKQLLDLEAEEATLLKMVDPEALRLLLET